MLHKFVVNNFLSIGENVVFNPNSSINLFYGENAAGKTNFLLAFSSMRNCILADDYKSQISVPKNLFMDSSEYTSFYVDFTHENQRVEYAIEMDDDRKVSEILVVSGEEIFKYENERLEVLNLSEVETERLESYKLYNRSILSILFKEFNLQDEKMSSLLTTVYKWFEESIVDLDETLSENEFGEMYNALSDERKSEFLLLCRKFNLALFDVVVKKEKRQVPEKIVQQLTALNDALGRHGIPTEIDSYDVFFLHSNDKKINYTMESSGTKKLIGFMLKMFSSRGKLILCDEFDDSFHHEVSCALLKMFQDNENQVILTTHSLEYLDNKNFGKRAFWFVEKDREEKSSLFCLDDIQGVRNDERHNWKKMYKSYRFGAYPKKIGVSYGSEHAEIS